MKFLVKITVLKNSWLIDDMETLETSLVGHTDFNEVDYIKIDRLSELDRAVRKVMGKYVWSSKGFHMDCDLITVSQYENEDGVYMNDVEVGSEPDKDYYLCDYEFYIEVFKEMPSTIEILEKYMKEGELI